MPKQINSPKLTDLLDVNHLAAEGKMKAETELMLALAKEVCKRNELLAYLRKRRYDDLVKAGFTEDQAMKLIIKTTDILV